MNQLEDFINLKFRDLQEELKYERAQRDQYLDFINNFDRRVRYIERAIKEYFGIDPTSFRYAEEETEEYAQVRIESIGEESPTDVAVSTEAPKASWLTNHETKEAVMLELLQVYYDCSTDEAKSVMDTTPRYNQWLRLTEFVIEHAGLHG